MDWWTGWRLTIINARLGQLVNQDLGRHALHSCCVCRTSSDFVEYLEEGLEAEHETNIHRSCSATVNELIQIARVNELLARLVKLEAVSKIDDSTRVR